MTKGELERRVRYLTVYAVGSSLLLIVFLLGGFEAEDVARYDKVVTERLEVVEPSGKPVLVAANSDRFPRAEDRASEGQTAKPGRQAGMVFYDGNEEEIGVLAYHATETDSGRYATTQLKFDRYGHNNVATLGHEETPAFRATGLLLNQQLGTTTDRDTRRRAELATAAGRSWLVLRDGQARPRIRMIVDSTGSARLLFLNKQGDVTDRYPPEE